MTHTAENDSLTEAFDRLSVPEFIRDALTDVVALAWDEGYDAAARDAYDGAFDPTANPYRVISPESRCTCGVGDHRPPGAHNIHCADPDSSATRVIPPEASAS